MSKAELKTCWRSCLLGLALLLGGVTACSSSPNEAQVTLGEQTIMLEIAMTQEEQERGLGGRDSLAQDRGMLFIYKTAGIRYIWMRNMRFPIDILWINSKGVIEHIERNVSPSSYPKNFTSPFPSHYILEVNAGVAAAVEVGSMVYFEHIPMFSDIPDAEQ